MTNIYQIWI